MAGRRKYETPEDFERMSDEYFDETPARQQTKAGWLIHMNMSRMDLHNYQNYEEFKDVVDRAMLRLEAKYELQLNELGRTADIFALKQYGWVDKQEVDSNVKGSINIISNIPRPKGE